MQFSLQRCSTLFSHCTFLSTNNSSIVHLFGIFEQEVTSVQAVSVTTTNPSIIAFIMFFSRNICII